MKYVGAEMEIVELDEIVFTELTSVGQDDDVNQVPGIGTM